MFLRPVVFRVVTCPQGPTGQQPFFTFGVLKYGQNLGGVGTTLGRECSHDVLLFALELAFVAVCDAQYFEPDAQGAITVAIGELPHFGVSVDVMIDRKPPFNAWHVPSPRPVPVPSSTAQRFGPSCSSCNSGRLLRDCSSRANFVSEIRSPCSPHLPLPA